MSDKIKKWIIPILLGLLGMGLYRWGNDALRDHAFLHGARLATEARVATQGK